MDDWRDTVRARLAELQLSPTREQEVVEEVCQHLEQRFEELKAGGTSEDLARRIVTDEIRELELARQMAPLRQAQAAPVHPPGRPSGLLAGLGDDLRLAARRLLATPVMSVAAILSLALGIGANTAIFSIADSLFRRPLPVERSEELVVVLAQPARVSTWSNPVWEQIRQRRHDLFETAFAYSARVSQFNLAATGPADLVDGVWVSGEYFEGLGVRPALGRGFLTTDDQRGGGSDGPVAVISDRLWRARYEQAADVVGRTVTVDRVPFTIVGVLPAGFFGADVGTRFDIALPLGTEPLLRGADSYLNRPTTSWLAIMARLKNGQDPTQAQSALLAAFPEIRATTTVESAPIGTSNMRGRYRRPLLVLLGVVTLVLAVACGNVANLQIVRALGRRKELSVRLALGASRWRVARELLVDSLVLAMLGTAVGLVLAQWLASALIRQLGTHANTVFLSVPIDERVVRLHRHRSGRVSSRVRYGARLVRVQDPTRRCSPHAGTEHH